MAQPRKLSPPPPPPVAAAAAAAAAVHGYRCNVSLLSFKRRRDGEHAAAPEARGDASSLRAYAHAAHAAASEARGDASSLRAFAALECAGTCG